MKNLKLTIVILLVLAAALAGMVGRCFYLQFFKADYYHAGSHPAAGGNGN